MVSFTLLKLAATASAAVLSLNNPDVDTSDTISDNLSNVLSVKGVKDDVNPCTPGERRSPE